MSSEYTRFQRWSGIRRGSLFCCALFCLMAGVAWGQWDTYVQLTDDDHTHYWAQVLVDSLYHVHLFDARTLNPGHWGNGPSSLFYQQFTNWGEPLTEAIDIIPGEGQFRYVSQPGLFLDSHGSIHVVCAVPGPPGPDFYYLRMNLDGEVVTPPYPVAPDQPFWFDEYANINMCETSNGDVWIACDQYYFVVNQAGEMIVPRQPVVTPFNYAMNAHFQCTTDDQVWAAIRYFGHPNYPQIAAVVRMDLPDQVPEVVSAPDSGELMQIIPGDFFVDAWNAFHFLIGRDDVGDFYQRDPRDGSDIDTVVIEPEPYGSLNTRFTLVGEDTLTYLWNRALPEPSVFRIGIHLSGEKAYGPIAMPENGLILTDGQHIQWRGGAYWMAGRIDLGGSRVWQSVMFHVPGTEEPVNAISERPAGMARESFSIWPNPTNGSITIKGPFAGLKSVSIYDVLGRRVQDLVLDNLMQPSVSAEVGALPSGNYFFRFVTRDGMEMVPLKIVR